MKYYSQALLPGAFDYFAAIFPRGKALQMIERRDGVLLHVVSIYSQS